MKIPQHATRIGLISACCVFTAVSCSSLPSSAPADLPQQSGQVQLANSRGPLSIKQSKAILEPLRRRFGDSDLLGRHIAVEEAVVGRPLLVGNQVSLLIDGPATYQAMFSAIEAARDHINLETYIYEDDELGRKVAEMLLAKQAQGVQVNLIYDSVGSINTPRAFFDRLRDAGIRVLEFNPVNPLKARKGWELNSRDHRKLLVVDGETAFLGGINISGVYSRGSFARSSGDKDKTPWRDTHLRIQGPAVAEFQRLFLETWQKQKGEALAARKYFPPLAQKGPELVRALGSAPDAEHSVNYLTLLSAIDSASDHISITNAYFVPDRQLLNALKQAARRGVQVKLILPGTSDFWATYHAGRSRYAELLAAGVRIFERRGALLHAKSAEIDGVWSCVGSTNLDWRSFLHNNEVDAAVLGSGFASQMQAMFQRDLQSSDEIIASQWSRRSLLMRIKEAGARIWQYWL
ncbi:cardiolipin synthase [Chitinimonas arctica]|uniref:Cardiolipin synthase n=1 Tax=Chitinimonas arctica TaxID=2594795 RepID=A0A516SBQ1_9NEIS|nr:cardiolipin synthase [Chitinimonas arctica]QDQ25574.1 cardiolipin synthase [Chitinimonas arctica]